LLLLGPCAVRGEAGRESGVVGGDAGGGHHGGAWGVDTLARQKLLAVGSHNPKAN